MKTQIVTIATGLLAAGLREYRRAASVERREVRALSGLELRAVTADEKSAGYIGALEGEIPYNSDSKPLTAGRSSRQFIERLKPGVFTRSLKEDRDIMGFAGHTDDPLAAFARVGENLTFTDGPGALRYRALVPDTQAGRDLLALVERKIIRGTSFEFMVRDGGQTVEAGAEYDIRTITEARLYAVNPVADPAYPESDLSAARRGAGASADAERRGAYYRGPGEPVDYYDPTITPDTKFAGCALSRATYALTDALEYLRAAPAGALADYARAEVAAAAANAKTLIDWLAANGATVNAEVMARAAEKVAEAKTATAPTPISNPLPSARERLLRIL